jgi:hypothetical protein
MTQAKCDKRIGTKEEETVNESLKQSEKWEYW